MQIPIVIPWTPFTLPSSPLSRLVPVLLALPIRAQPRRTIYPGTTQGIQLPPYQIYLFSPHTPLTRLSELPRQSKDLPRNGEPLEVKSYAESSVDKEPIKSMCPFDSPSQTGELSLLPPSSTQAVPDQSLTLPSLLEKLSLPSLSRQFPPTTPTTR